MSGATLDQLISVVAGFFNVPKETLDGQTSASDIDGWDSVSQATLVFELEDAFGVTLEFADTLRCENLDALAALLAQSQPQSQPSAEADASQLASVIFFGNCQAESLAACLKSHSGLAGQYDVHFVQSFSIGGDEDKTRVSPEILARCVLLVEQLTPKVRFGYADQLPATCKTVTFPSLDFNLLWPLHAVEPRNHPESGFPFGRYSYGDRIINAVVADGLKGDAAWAAYEARSGDALRNLSRLEKIERQRWDNLDSGLTVRMAPEIFGRFRTERLFYTYNHPTSDLLCILGALLLRAASLVDDQSPEETLAELRRLFTWEFGADYAVPIHPLVAKAFALEWWTPDLRYRWRDQAWTYEEAIRKQIDWA